MAPALLQHFREADDVQRGSRDASRDSLLVLGKRQGPSSSSSQTSSSSVAQVTTGTPFSSSAQFVMTSQPSSSTSGSDTRISLSLPTSSLSTSQLNISQSLSGPNPTTSSYSSSDRAALSSEGSKAVVFGIIGSVLGFLLLGLIVFKLLRRYQQTKSRKHTFHDSFWGKWNWGTYSPVDEDTTFPDADAQEKVPRNTPSYTWWQKFGFNGVSEVRRTEGKKKNSMTLYKVRRSKPGEDFDIDSSPPLQL